MEPEWKSIAGFKYPYRISDQGVVQKLDQKKGWVVIVPKSGKCMYVRLRTIEGKQMTKPVNSLMDEYFFDNYAKKNNLRVAHKNGAKMDCSRDNIYFTTQSELGKRHGGSGRRRPVVRIWRGEKTFYRSVAEAANKNGLSNSSLERRIRGVTLDQKGRKFEYCKE